MKQYIWFHPLYIQTTRERTYLGQAENAKLHGYTLLQEKELHKVGTGDHLTIVGHSSAPVELMDVHDELDAEADTGRYIQGDTAQACVTRLQKSGLKVAPKLLSLECCQAAVDNGFAESLSAHPFFQSTVIEACSGGIGRNDGYVRWGGFKIDCFGRAIMAHGTDKPWIFFLGGSQVAQYSHGAYKLDDVIQTIFEHDFHARFFAHYNPGIFGGRVGRYCRATGRRITFEQATLFAERKPGSATAMALDALSKEPVSDDNPHSKPQ